MQLTHTRTQTTNGHRVWLSYVLIRVHNYFFFHYLFFVSPPPLFLPFHLSFLSFPMCWKTLWTFSLFPGALQSAARGPISLTPLQPPVREQFGHSGEDVAAVFSPGDAHHQVPRHHQYVFYQRDDVIARGESTRFCSHLQTSHFFYFILFLFSRKGESAAFSIPS